MAGEGYSRQYDPHDKDLPFITFEDGCILYGVRSRHLITKQRKLRTLQKRLDMTRTFIHPKRYGSWVYA